VQRIAKSFRRVVPAKVDERKAIVEKHLLRRVYVVDYYGQRAHIDLQCKLQFGDVRMYIYGHADGDARYMLRLTLLFVKTARALLYQGYMPALAVDGMVADELTTVDGGTEFNMIKFARRQQGLPCNETRSVHNTRIERPWLDVGVKAVSLVRKSVEGLEAAGIHNPLDIHNQYALRCAIHYVLEYGLDEFRTRYNEHNVPGPRGGVPWRRRQDRTRPPTAPPPSLFDSTTDWAGAYAAHTGKPHHAEDHFVELYSLEVLRLMPQHSAGPLPSHERAWKDVKLHRGARGEFRQIYAAALHASRARATADSVRASESACMVARGSRAVSED